MKATKPTSKITFRDRLSRLTFLQACKLLGPRGKKLISQGGQISITSPDQVYLGGDLMRLSEIGAIATLTLVGSRRDRLQWNCTECDEPCEHVGALFSYLLEHKTELRLAEPPKERTPIESLDEPQLVRLAIDERGLRARKEPMKVQSADPTRPWTDYVVTSTVSGKSYRVALRGMHSGDSFCSCPDFRTNTLGTCKHLLKVEAHARRRFDRDRLRRPYVRKRAAVHLRYGNDVTLHLAPPRKMSEELAAILAPLGDGPVTDVLDLVARLEQVESLGHPVQVYPDAEEYIQHQLHALRLQRLVQDIRQRPETHPLRTSLLRIPLLPYQLDGVAFAAEAGRAILADDMGLGKTIQGVGVAELLAREVGIRKVLIVCPASLKSQWRNEIRRFVDRDVQVIAGRTAERGPQYARECFFTVCNYEQVLKDYLDIEHVPWDLIILDEGQRIKNWETKTSRVIKGLRSRFALVLSGTPLENRLDELYSVVQFIDDRRLGPGFRFFNRHRIVDEKGKLLGYKHLDDLRTRLRPVLLRRTRASVRLELPERTDEYVRIAPTDEQLALHNAHLQTVLAIVRKKFLTEMDLLRLRIALLMCRMSANSTFLVNKEQPAYSSKLERLAELFDDLADEADRKVVLFSEWTTMLDLIEPLLRKRNLRFARLDGSVPQAEREALVLEFQTDPKCRFFITTNAGSTGLNLQAANTVVNVDLPWNPAVLEQRIARAHRMGQTRQVQVFILVTEKTLEENLLETLNAKRELALAALDSESQVDFVTMVNGGEELKQRLEVLLGAKPEAPVDESVRATCHVTTASAASLNASVSGANGSGSASSTKGIATSTEHRQRVAAAGGELLGAVFQFLGELVDSGQSPSAPESTLSRVREQLESCVEYDDQDRPRINFALPNREALNRLAHTLATLVSVGNS